MSALEKSDRTREAYTGLIEQAKREVRLFNLKDGGAYMGVSYWVMRDLVNSGAIPSVKIPRPRAKDGRVIRRILVDRKDLDEFIEHNKERAE